MGSKSLQSTAPTKDWHPEYTNTCQTEQCGSSAYGLNRHLRMTASASPASTVLISVTKTADNSGKKEREQGLNIEPGMERKAEASSLWLHSQEAER